jgi:hypothetical protein
VSSWPTATSRQSACKSIVRFSCGGWPPLSGKPSLASATRHTSTNASARRAAGVRGSGPSSPRNGTASGSSAAETIAALSTSSAPNRRMPPSPSADSVNPRRRRARRSLRSNCLRSLASARSGLTCASARSPNRRNTVGSYERACSIRIASTLSAVIGSSPGTSATTRPIAPACVALMAPLAIASASAGRASMTLPSATIWLASAGVTRITSRSHVVVDAASDWRRRSRPCASRTTRASAAVACEAILWRTTAWSHKSWSASK